MAIRKLLIANRGEIAIRIARAAGSLGVQSVAMYAEDDAASLHVRMADASVQLKGRGARSYLDSEQIVAAAREQGCDAVHPGYGFLSERASFAQQCRDAGLTFVGPTPETLQLFGNKWRARELARSAGVPVLEGVPGPATPEQVLAFVEALPEGAAAVIKAVAGGGGRGMRVVRTREEAEAAYERCASEAQAAFGSGELYVERYLPRARHVEVQIMGDANGNLAHLWDRECSLQRRHQKLIEVAPAPGLDQDLRNQLVEAALAIGTIAGYTNAGTIEFLVPADGASELRFAFIEANARLQVEHTVTEEVTGIDIVAAQLRLAGGASLGSLGLGEAPPEARGFAIQCRVNMETMAPDGTPRPAGGTITAFEPPSGPGVRTDTFGYSGYRTSGAYDSLLAKVICSLPRADFATVAKQANRALGEFRIEGVATNIRVLQAILAHPTFQAGEATTEFFDDNLTELLEAADAQPQLFADAGGGRLEGRAGAKIDALDPLAVLDFGKQSALPATTPHQMAGDDFEGVPAPVQGTIVSIDVAVGDAVRAGQQLAVMEAMKMEHVVSAPWPGVVESIEVGLGEAVYEGARLFALARTEQAGDAGVVEEEIDPDYIRPDLAEIVSRHEAKLDAARPAAVERRRKTGQRTARENVDDLCDPGTFVEHGGLVLTPGTGLPTEEVVRRFPGDGMVTGVGNVNGETFGNERSRTVVLAYDYTVLAGTQGAINHPKTDRMLELAEKWELPVVFFTEGGGGRAGTGGRRPGGRDATDQRDNAYRPLDTPTFATMARLSGRVPLVGVNSGRCFAGNAALLGCCDVIIATANSNIGMGGPAMIEGGGLGVFAPEEVGPMGVQVPNGVVDVAVKDEAEAVAVAKQYLAYFQGRSQAWDAPDQRRMRHIVPENRLRMYDVRKVVETVADEGSVLELRPQFGLGMVTALVRIEGRPVGILANNPSHLAGAIDSDGSDKAARFMQLCDAFRLPLIVLCDTPGMMVGPEVEKTALVRHCSRLFVTGANLTIPHFTVVLRKAYGLGAQAMAGGSFKEPFFAVAWPTGEFGGMGLEGQVKLGYRNELAAIEDPEKRVARYEELVEKAYQRGKALNSGVSFQVDDVIDPADTRAWLANGLRSVREEDWRGNHARPNLDTW